MDRSLWNKLLSKEHYSRGKSAMQKGPMESQLLRVLLLLNRKGLGLLRLVLCSSFWMELHLPGKHFKTEGKQELQGVSETDQIHQPPPPQRKHERLQRVTFGYRKLQRKLWQAQLLERSQDDSTTWKRLSSTDPTWKEQASTCSGTCKLCSRSPTFVSCHPCWGGLWWCRCLWVISSPVSNPSLTFL